MMQSMRAALIHSPGTDSGLSLVERPVPSPGPGEVLVRLHAAALNHRDLNFLHGVQGAGMQPFVPGSDGAGTVAALGAGVGGWQPGDAVIIDATLSCDRCEFCRAGEQSLCEHFGILGGPSDGTWAEYVCVPAANLLPAPEHLDLTAAAALPLSLGTAWRAVVHRAALRPGETVLIHGIGGGVALFALQIAVGCGCRVIVTSGSAAKLERALAMGAWAGIDYRADDVAQRVAALTGGRGADLVVDGVGRATLPTSLAAARRGGRIVHFGSHSGVETLLHNRTLFWKQVSLIGSTMNSRTDLRAALQFYAQRRLQPVISHRFPLTRAAEVAPVMERAEQFGKIVIEIGRG